MAWAPWFGAATETLGTPVADGVRLVRPRPYAWLVNVGWTAIGAALVLLNYFVWHLPPPLVFLPVMVASIGLPRLQGQDRYAVLTDDDRLWLLTASGSEPEALIGPLDPEQVSRPVGLFRHTFVIAGVRHHVAPFYKKPFQQMLETARR